MQSGEKKAVNKNQRCGRTNIHTGELMVTTPGHFVGIRSGQIVVRQKQTIIAEMPSMQLKGLTLAGRGVSLSSDLVSFCAEQDIHIHFIDGLGKIVSVAYPPSGLSVDLHIRQIKHAEDDTGHQIARMIIYGKVKNQHALLKYFGKYRRSKSDRFNELLILREPEMKDLIAKICHIRSDGDDKEFKQKLMGFEGAFGAIYWKLISSLLPETANFSARHREGATDLINSLLNYGYGVLYSRILDIVIRKGLNPACSFLHACQSDRPSLIYDIIEEFRAFGVDRAVFTLINRRQCLELDKDSRLTDNTRKKLAQAVLDRLSSEMIFRQKRIALEKIIEHQVDHLKQVMMTGGKYRPFLARW